MNSFLSKVEAERNVLSIVNSYTKGKGQLAGLSNPAISNWCTFNGISESSNASKSLRILGDLCNSLSDRSNENFVNIPTERLIKIETEKSMLSDVLMGLFKESA